MNEFDELFQLYKTKFNGYCLYRYEKWQHSHRNKYREEYVLMFEFHDQISVENLPELIIKAEQFKKNIEAGLLTSEAFEYKNFKVTLNELENGFTAIIKSDEKEFTFTPKTTHSMSDAIEKTKIFIDGILA